MTSGAQAAYEAEWPVLVDMWPTSRAVGTADIKLDGIDPDSMLYFPAGTEADDLFSTYDIGDYVQAIIGGFYVKGIIAEKIDRRGEGFGVAFHWELIADTGVDAAGGSVAIVRFWKVEEGEEFPQDEEVGGIATAIGAFHEWAVDAEAELADRFQRVEFIAEALTIAVCLFWGGWFWRLVIQAKNSRRIF